MTRCYLSGLLLALSTPIIAKAEPNLSCAIEAVPDPATGSVTLTVTVDNAGTSASTAGATDAFVLLWADLPQTPTLADNPTADWPLTLLNANQSTTFEAGPLNVGQGTFKAWCWVNPDIGGGTFYEPDELDMSDNIATLDYVVGPPPVPVPDLVVKGLGSKPLPGGGTFDVTFTVTIKNEGTADAPPFDVDIYPDDALTPEQAGASPINCLVGSGISAGATVTVECGSYNGWTEADIGQQSIFVYADREDTMGEENREDNFYQGEVTVTGPPNLILNSLTAVAIGDTVTYEVEVKNAGGSTVPDAEVCFWFYGVPEPGSQPDAVLTVSLAVGALQAVSTTQAGSPGGTFTAYVELDCRDVVDELNEADNSASKTYTVAGVPNVPPVIGEITGTPACTETVECAFEVTASDTTSLPTLGLSWRALGAPPGFQIFRPVDATKTDGTAHIRYVPPLGSAAKSVSVTIEAADLVSKSTRVLTFSVNPPTDFEGLVGAVGSLPASAKGGCPLIEIPGSGFAQIDNTDKLLRVFSANATVPNLAKAQPSHILGLVQLDAKSTALWSCHVQPLSDGGFALLELNTQTVHLLPAGALSTGAKPGQTDRKVALPKNIYSGTFTSTDGRTLVFLSVFAQDEVGNPVSSATLAFIDSVTGKLDPAWGGNADAVAGAGTPGVLDLYDPVGGSFVPYEGYLWAHPDGVRVYNRHFSRRELVEYNQTGTTTLRSPIQSILPPDPKPTEQPPWTLMAAADGGLQLLDLDEGTLEWYAPDPTLDGATAQTFSPVGSFTLAAPGGTAKLGHVSAQAYGLSISNLTCASLAAGGFTCHDVVERRGFVVNVLGSYWDGCPSVDISPASPDFGALAQGQSRVEAIRISNLGGATLVLDATTIFPDGGTPAGSYTESPILSSDPVFIAPYGSFTIPVTFAPKKAGQSTATLAIDSNACKPISLGLKGHSGPRLYVSPSSVNFVGVTPGEHTQKVTITSVGSSDLSVTAVQLSSPSGRLSLIPGVVPGKVLAPGQSLEFSVRLDATIPGTFTGELSLLSNDASQGVRKVAINGTTAARVAAVPAGFNFGAVPAGSTVSRTITLTNAGFTTLTLDAPALISAEGFTLDTAAFVPVLAPGASTTLTLRAKFAAGSATGTRAGLVMITHDGATEPPVVLHAIAGEATTFNTGFDGSLELQAADGGPFSGSVVPSSFVHLSTGGFAVASNAGSQILVVTGRGTADPAFGTNGVVDVRKAFPTVTGDLDGLIELIDGGFAMLDRAGRRIVAIRPDGTPHAYIGQGGLLYAPAVFPFNGPGATLGRALGQVPKLPGGALVMSEITTHTLAFLTRAGTVDGSYTNPKGTAGIWEFSGTRAIAGGGLANTVGDSVGLSDTSVVVADPATKGFYALSIAGSQSAEPAKNSVTGYDGVFATGPGNTFLYLDPSAATVSRHVVPALTLDPTFGQAGKVTVANAFASAAPITAVAAVNSGFAVVDFTRRAVLVLSEDGTAFVATPKAVITNLPEDISFGVVPVGTTSAPHTIAVTNNGKVDLNVTALFDQPAFGLVGGATSLVVSAGQTRTLDVVFAPKSVSLSSGTLRIVTNDAAFDATPHVVSLFGSTGPLLVLEPATARVDFGFASAKDPTERAFFVRNAGADAVTVGTPSVTGSGFALATGLSTSTLAPGGSAEKLVVRFSPTKVGQHDGALTLTPNDGTPPLTVALTGGSGPLLDLSPATIACEGGVPGQAQLCGTLTLRNGGTSALSVASITVTSPEFSLVGPVGPSVLAPGGQAVTLDVIARPGHSGLSAGEIRIAHNSGGSTGVAVVPATVLAGQSLVVAPSAVSFVGVPVGGTAYRSVFVSGPADLLAATITGSTAITLTGAPTLPTDATLGLELQVGCTPAAVGEVSATLRLASNATGTPLLSVPVRCTGGSALAASPAAIDFGGVTVGSNAVRAVVLSSAGGSASITGVSTGGSAVFSVSAYAGTLAANTSAPIFVTFAPAGLGEATGTLTVTRATGAPLLIPLSGRSGAHIALAGEPLLDFGSVAVGTIAERAMVVRNIGSDDLTVGSPTLEGLAPFSFGTVDTSAFAAGTSRLVPVRFAPASLGVFEAEVTLPWTGGSLQFTARGRAGGELLVEPATLDFGTVTAGGSASRKVVVRNLGHTGELDLTAALTGVSAAFSASGLPDNTTLAPGASREVTLTFAPPTAGQYSGEYAVSSTKGIEGSLTRVALKGKSGGRLLLLDPASGQVTFRSVPVGGAVARSLRLAAGPESGVSVLGYSLTGDREAFAVTDLSQLPFTVAAGSATSALQVSCAPKQRRIFRATLTLATDAASAPVTIALTCATPALVTPTPAALDFASAASGTTVTRSVTLKNGGASAVTVTQLIVEASNSKAGFATSGVTTPFTLEPGAERVVSVLYAPKGNGAFTGSLRVRTNDPVSDGVEVPLAGVTGPRLALSPAWLNLCRQTAGRDVEVRNTGSAPLVIDTLGFEGGTAQGFDWRWKTNPGTVTTVLAPGETRTLVITFDGTLAGGARVGGATIGFDANDAQAPPLRVAAGLGYATPDNFTGTADLLAPGQAAYPAISGPMDGGAAELCTGGFATASLASHQLVYAHPGGDGVAIPLTGWGTQGGATDLAAVARAAGIPSAFANDLGVTVRSVSAQTGLLALVAPGAGRIVLLALDGSIARGQASGGVLNIDAVAGAVSAPTDVAARGTSANGDPSAFVVLDTRGGQLLGLNAAGQADPTFGDAGRVSLAAAFPTGVSDQLVSMTSLAPDVYAVLDAGKERVLVVKANGAPDTVYGGGSGVIDLSLKGLLPQGRGGAVALANYNPGIAVLDRTRGDVTVLTSIGDAFETVGADGRFDPIGAYPPAAGAARRALSHALVVTSEAGSAGAGNSGHVVVADSAGGDWLFVGPDGAPLAKSVPTLALTGCPVDLTLAKNQLSGQRSIALKNAGQQFLVVKSVDPGIADLGCSLGQSSCSNGTTISPGQTVQATFTWEPDALGCVDGVVTIAHEGVNGPVHTCPIHLGTAGGFEVTPGGTADLNRYDFPPLAVGSEFTREFTIRNTGCAPLPLENVVLGGQSATFALALDPIGPVPPGGVFGFRVTCRPQQSGEHTDAVSFVVQGEDAPAINLRCTTGARLETSPTAIKWNAVPVGGSDTDLIQLTNTGGSPATIAGAAGNRYRVTEGQFKASGEVNFVAMDAATLATVFDIAAEPAEASWPVGTSRTLGITFAPAEAGTYRANLEFTSDSYTASKHIIPLEGTTAPEVIFVPATADVGTVGPGSSRCVSVTATNNGAEFAGYEIDASSLAGSVFSLTRPEGAPTCSAPDLSAGLNLQPGASVEFAVWCSPGEKGAFEGQLAIEADADVHAVDGYLYLPMRCVGGRCLSLSASTLAFDDTTWEGTSEATLTLSNDSDADITATVALQGDGAPEFVLSDESVVVPAGGSKTLTLTFDPSDEPGKRKATLVVNDPDCDVAVHKVALSAWALPPTVEQPGNDVSSGDSDVSSGADTSSGGDTASSGGDASGTADTKGLIEAYSGCGCRLDGAPRQEPGLGSRAAALALLLGLWAIRRRR